MPDGPIDPASLEGDDLTRWYLRSPDEIEQERQALAAQRYQSFFGQPDPDPGIERQPYDPQADIDPGIVRGAGAPAKDVDPGISWVRTGPNRWRSQPTPEAAPPAPVPGSPVAAAPTVAAHLPPLTTGFRSPLDMAQDALRSFQSGPKIPRPNLAESFIPVVGPAWEAAGDLQDGNYGGAAFNAAMAVGDALPLGAISKAPRQRRKASGFSRRGPSALTRPRSRSARRGWLEGARKSTTRSHSTGQAARRRTGEITTRF